MMAAKDVKIATDNLSCPVCYQLFTKPKYLPCHHSYCEQCLETMQVQSKIICPECRKEAIVPPGGVKDLDDNFLINRLVDEFILKRKVEGEEETKCDECQGEDPVVVFCPDCTLFLCHVCNECHKHSIKSCDHGIVPLNKLRSRRDIPIKLKPKSPVCSEHEYELKHYCESCDELVCLYCTMKKHYGHNHNIVSQTMVDKHREELKKITATVEEMIRGLSETHDNIEKMRIQILQQVDDVNKKIDQHYDRVVQKLIEQKEELKQQVCDTVSQKEKAVATQLEEVECAQAEMLSMKKLNDAVEKSSDQEVLSVKKQLIDRMQQITDKYKKVNLQPVNQATLEFVSIIKALPQFGSLRSVDSYKCETVVLPKYNISGEKTEVNIITKDNNGGRSRGGSQVSVQLGGVNDTTQAGDYNDGSYMASFVPQQVREMELSVFVNGQQIKGSPYSVMVKDYTSVNKPSKVLNNDGNMGRPWGIAFAKNGMWAVADCSNHCVYIFDGEDRLVRKIGREGSRNGRFNSPEGVSFDSNGYLYVADFKNHRIQKFTIDGKYQLQFGSKGSDDGKLQYPMGVALHDYKVYVADSLNNRISVFQADGKFHSTIGSGQLSNPHDLTVNGDNQLLVADYGNHCIHTFTLDGDHVGKFGTYGAGRGQLDHPYGVAVDLYGFILVVDSINHRVSIFNKDGNFVHCFGSYGPEIGQFHCPIGIAVSANGNIYVSDCKNERIQIFTNEYHVAHTIL